MNEQPVADAPMIEHALYLAALGQATGAFKVFPCQPGGKEPVAGLLWPKEASWDRKTVAATWDNYPDANPALAIQPGFVCLDIDTYKTDSALLFREFEAKHGLLPASMEFRSARGGIHLIYKADREIGCGRGDLPAFCDVKGVGGYIVGPGSTFEGARYTVVDADPPEPLPACIDAPLKAFKARAEGPKRLPRGVVLDDPVNIERFIAWCEGEARLGQTGVDGNLTLAATGAMGCSFGLSCETTLDIVRNHWNPRQDEPWDEARLVKHGASGYNSAPNFGNKARPDTSRYFDDLTRRERGQLEAGMFHRMDAISGPAPARDWAVGSDDDGWLPMGDITTLYGAGGVGKTCLAGQICLTVARGDKLFGRIPTRQMPAVLVACEDPPDELHRRFEAQGGRITDAVTFASFLGQGTALHPPFRQAGGEDTPFYCRLRDHLAMLPAGPKLLVLDNLAQIYHGNYYEPSEIARFLNEYLRRLTAEFDTTSLVLAHPSESQRASGDGSFGGIGWSAGVRSRLYLERHMTKASKKGDKARPISGQLILSRKKGNYSPDDGEGVILQRAGWLMKPVEARAARGESPFPAADAKPPTEFVLTHLDLVEEAIAKHLASNTLAKYTHVGISEVLAVKLGMSGDTIRTKILPALLARQTKWYDVDLKPARWHHG